MFDFLKIQYAMGKYNKGTIIFLCAFVDFGVRIQTNSWRKLICQRGEYLCQ